MDESRKTINNNIVGFYLLISYFYVIYLYNYFGIYSPTHISRIESNTPAAKNVSLFLWPDVNVHPAAADNSCRY